MASQQNPTTRNKPKTKTNTAQRITVATLGVAALTASLLTGTIHSPAPHLTLAADHLNATQAKALLVGRNAERASRGGARSLSNLTASAQPLTGKHLPSVMLASGATPPPALPSKAPASPAATAAPANTQTAAPVTGTPRAQANRLLAHNMMLNAGFAESQWVCLDYVWTHESDFDHQAVNPEGGTGAAGGIPQAKPASKMGAGWQSSPSQQIAWGLTYIAGRYGSPCDAQTFWKSHRWY